MKLRETELPRVRLLMFAPWMYADTLSPRYITELLFEMKKDKNSTVRVFDVSVDVKDSSDETYRFAMAKSATVLERNNK